MKNKNKDITLKFGTYYRTPALTLNMPVPCYICGNPFDRKDKNTYKIIYKCNICNIILHIKLNEKILNTNDITGINVDNIPSTS